MRTGILTETALATIIVIEKMGQGVPTYLFEGYDIIDAIAEGFVEEIDNGLFLTNKAKVALRDLQLYKNVTSFRTSLSKKLHRATGRIQ